MTVVEWLLDSDPSVRWQVVRDLTDALADDVGAERAQVATEGWGVTYALARAAVDFARQRDARALEGYPMILEPGQDIHWGELHVGNRSVFAAAGFSEVSHPTLRRVVMRIDF